CGHLRRYKKIVKKTYIIYYKYQYRITYTLCCGLNRLQVYVTEIKEKQIFERIQVANMSTF
ncbi:MAG: hypothetical protein ACLR3Z_17675, partial [Anaerostipes hadrus]